MVTLRAKGMIDEERYGAVDVGDLFGDKDE